MKITNNTLQLSAKETLLSLKVKTECLQADASKKTYLRSIIGKIKKENNTINFKTKVENGSIFIWRTE